jgi:hypothetical protein
MTLRLIASASTAEPSAFDLPPYQLSRQPTRPGVSHTEIPLKLPDAVVEAVVPLAASDGVPTAVWLGLAVESERAIAGLGLSGPASAGLRSQLDDFAARPIDPVMGGAQQLASFAMSLRTAPRSGKSMGEPTSARVPYGSRTIWRLAATEAEETVDSWAARLLVQATPRRALWEAAAAERGVTLPEWILGHCARR